MEVQNVKVGRGEKTKLVPIDSAKLEAALRIRGYSKSGASKKLMRSNSFFNNILYNNGATKVTIEMIHSVLGIPPEEYILKPDGKEQNKPGQVPDPDCTNKNTELLESVDRQLGRIADALETLASVPQVSVTRAERCTLLLKQMLCYGTCLFNDFEKKATAYGFTKDEVKEAVKLAGASKELKGGTDIWLKRGSK